MEKVGWVFLILSGLGVSISLALPLGIVLFGALAVCSVGVWVLDWIGGGSVE